MSKREREKESIGLMIGIYCRGNHHTDKVLCEDCRELLVYAEQRLSACPFAAKPACRDCTIHCYSPDRRKAIQAVMRYAGPRMLLHAPLAALGHLVRKKKGKLKAAGKKSPA